MIDEMKYVTVTIKDENFEGRYVIDKIYRNDIVKDLIGWLDSTLDQEQNISNLKEEAKSKQCEQCSEEPCNVVNDLINKQVK